MARQLLPPISHTRIIRNSHRAVRPGKSALIRADLVKHTNPAFRPGTGKLDTSATTGKTDSAETGPGHSTGKERSGAFLPHQRPRSTVLGQPERRGRLLPLDRLRQHQLFPVPIDLESSTANRDDP